MENDHGNIQLLLSLESFFFFVEQAASSVSKEKFIELLPIWKKTQRTDLNTNPEIIDIDCWYLDDLYDLLHSALWLWDKQYILLSKPILQIIYDDICKSIEKDNEDTSSYFEASKKVDIEDPEKLKVFLDNLNQYWIDCQDAYNDYSDMMWASSNGRYPWPDKK